MKTIIVKDKTHQKLMKMKKAAQHHSLDEVISSMYDDLKSLIVREQHETD